MSLFPAYTFQEDFEDVKNFESDECYVVGAALERQLLASDEEAKEAEEAPRRSPLPAAPAPAEPLYYVDNNMDWGNLRVSTLYYPGRPEYSVRHSREAIGGAARRRKAARERTRRYYERPAPDAAPDPALVRRRAAELRQALAARPAHEPLWLAYLRFQEDWADAGEALAAARDAVAACDTRRVREALARARERALPPAALLAELRDDVAAAREPARRLSAWLRLLAALGGAAGVAGGERRMADAAAAALDDCAAHALAYPRVLHAYGAWARAAGLWERLVLLVELVAAMNFPPTACFPPAGAGERRAALEAELAAAEERAVRSGLPLSVVWARVERLRAAARWRAAAPGEDAGADPQRTPAAAELAPLLRAARPAARFLLAATLLRLGKVPVLPRSERAARALGWADASAAEELLGVARAARRLPPAHAASRAAALRPALTALLDPPHYFTDAAGYLSWVNALWEACCEWFEGRRRLALVCWRLRWLHALARLAEPAEARRLRGAARALIKRHAPAEPVAFAHFARLEAETSAGAARAAALRAARAAAPDAALPAEHALFAARVVAELGAAGDAAARWALCCAALRRALPPDAELARAPPAALLERARARIDERCAELERGWGAPAAGDDACEDEGAEDALLPGAGEWAAARVALMSPAERQRALRALVARDPLFSSGAELEYREREACALAAAAASERRLGDAARALTPLLPLSALPALGAAAAGAPPAGEGGAGAALARAAAALARDGGWAGAARAAGGALPALRLAAEARGAGSERALWAELARRPDHKWLYVRGAEGWPARGAQLADALLERELRLHALPDELHPI